MLTRGPAGTARVTGSVMPTAADVVLTSSARCWAERLNTGVTVLNDSARWPAKPVGVSTKNDVSPVGCTTLSSGDVADESALTENAAFCTVTTTVFVPAAEVRTVTPTTADSACPATVRVAGVPPMPAVPNFRLTNGPASSTVVLGSVTAAADVLIARSSAPVSETGAPAGAW